MIRELTLGDIAKKGNNSFDYLKNLVKVKRNSVGEERVRNSTRRI